MWYEVCDMDSYITSPYQIADHHCMITWVYNKVYGHTSRDLDLQTLPLVSRTDDFEK